MEYEVESADHCLLFAAHTHTIAACFAGVPRLCYLILVSLSTLLLTAPSYITYNIQNTQYQLSSWLSGQLFHIHYSLRRWVYRRLSTDNYDSGG